MCSPTGRFQSLRQLMGLDRQPHPLPVRRDPGVSEVLKHLPRPAAVVSVGDPETDRLYGFDEPLADGQLLAVNAPFGVLLERDPSWFRARHFAELTTPDTLTLDLAKLDELRQGARSGYEIAKEYLLPDGTPLPVRISVVMVSEPAGCARYYLALVDDMRPELQAQAAARIARDELTGEVERLKQKVQRLGHIETDPRSQELRGKVDGILARLEAVRVPPHGATAGGDA